MKVHLIILSWVFGVSLCAVFLDEMKGSTCIDLYTKEVLQPGEVRYPSGHCYRIMCTTDPEQKLWAEYHTCPPPPIMIDPNHIMTTVVRPNLTYPDCCPTLALRGT